MAAQLPDQALPSREKPTPSAGDTKLSTEGAESGNGPDFSQDTAIIQALQQLNQRLAQLEAHEDERLRQTSEKFRQMEEKTNEKFRQMEEQIDGLLRQTNGSFEHMGEQSSKKSVQMTEQVHMMFKEMTQQVNAKFKEMAQQLNESFEQVEKQILEDDDGFETKISAVDQNSTARTQNSMREISDVELVALVNITTAEKIPGFPLTPDILRHTTDTVLNAVLFELGLDTGGSEEDKRTRLRIAIGLRP